MDTHATNASDDAIRGAATSTWLEIERSRTVARESEQAALLAHAIRERIEAWREHHDEAPGAGFSVDASYSAGKFAASVSFDEDHDMTVWVSEGADDAEIEALWSLDDSSILDVAATMLDEGWVDGFPHDPA